MVRSSCILVCSGGQAPSEVPDVAADPEKPDCDVLTRLA